MRLAFLLTLALATGGPATAADPWPTLEFEVYEGYGPNLTSTRELDRARQAGFETLDVPAPTAAPLSPALKAEMQAYLSSVAAEYQRMGFPAPALEPIVTRADGKKAYRVYWYAFGNTRHMASQRESTARMSYACKGEVHARRMHLNAWVEGANGTKLRLARSTGQALGMVDRLTDKGYSDLAHELFHAVQRGTAFFDANCYPPKWLFEGTAEAVGHDMAWQLRGVLSREPYEQVNRWGLRPYHLPFAFVPADPDDDDYAYTTSSFWRYLAELDHKLQSTQAPAPRPDATPLVRRDAFDYRYLARLLSDSTKLSGPDQTLDWLNDKLRTDVRLKLGFDRAFADFQTVFADYGRYRVIGQQPPEKKVLTVQKLTLDGCQEYRLDVSAPISHAPARLSLPVIGAGCIRLVRADAGIEPLLLDIRALVDEKSAPSLYAGVAGEPRATPATIAAHKPGVSVASWAVQVPPGGMLDIVFTNVHKTPLKTRAVDIEVEFAISGWQWIGPPAPPAAARPAPQDDARPRPRRTAPRSTESKPVQQGPGTARLERQQVDPPSRPCRWRHADAALHCQPTMELVLRRVPRWLAWQEASAGPDEDDLASEGALLAFTASRSADAIDALDELQVRIKLPQLDHGFSGPIENVLIKVSGGGWDELVSRGPRNAETGGLSYYAASGRMTVDRYDPLEFRGSFQGAMVALPPPGVFKGQTPLDVVTTVSGNFTVGRPWEHDDRFVPVVPDMQDMVSDIFDQLPGSLRTDPRFAPFAPASEPDRRDTGQPGANVPAGCDCSCAGKDAVLEALEQLDDGSTESTPAMIPKAMCLLQCQAQYSACPEP